MSTDPLLVDLTRHGLGLMWEEVEPTFDPHHGPEAARREIFGRLGYGNRSSSGPPALMDAQASGARNVSASPSGPAPAWAPGALCHIGGRPGDRASAGPDGCYAPAGPGASSSIT